MSDFSVVIPARYKSSRYPGKPLVDLLGKSMIQHVWERCCEAVGIEKVVVATDDSRIKEVCESFGAKVIMTSENCMTGTDRLAEVNRVLDKQFLINVQGDEPLIKPENILKVLSKFKESGNVTNAMCKISSTDEFFSLTVPKVVFSNSRKLLYMTRSSVPLTKSGEYVSAYKQVCIYAFSKEHLRFFSSFREKSCNEAIEDIEILRFLDNDIPVDMVEVNSGSLAIDIPSDVEKVLRAMKVSV